MSLVVTLSAGAVFGFAPAAPSGPMNAIIAEESVLRGFSLLQDAMFLIDGLLMLYLAYGAVRSATGTFRTQGETDSRGFSRASLLSLSNPYQILFWLTVGVGLSTPGSPAGALAFGRR
jgi:threonine/homoserine/homoserine lactone efflux protein